MPTLKFYGEVKHLYNKCFIDNDDIIKKISETFEDNQKINIALGDERFIGDLYILLGLDGYSEWTPPRAFELMIGDHDLFDRLKEKNGEFITLWISDQPINTLE